MVEKRGFKHTWWRGLIAWFRIKIQQCIIMLFLNEVYQTFLKIQSRDIHLYFYKLLSISIQIAYTGFCL